MDTIDTIDREDRDEALVRRALAGDVTAFERLVRRYRRAALARALAIVGDTFEAEDVAQMAFVRAYEQLATLHDHERFASWLMTIVHRRSLNALRSESRRRATTLTDTIANPAASENADAQETAGQRAALLAALARLSPAQRMVVLLADLENWPHQRIASAVGCSIAMSRRHLSDARKRLREILKQQERR